MLAEIVITLEAVLVILAVLSGLFGGAWLWGYFFSSGREADDAFKQAAEFMGHYSWGWFWLACWAGFSGLIGFLAYHVLKGMAGWMGFRP